MTIVIALIFLAIVTPAMVCVVIAYHARRDRTVPGLTQNADGTVLAVAMAYGRPIRKLCRNGAEAQAWLDLVTANQRAWNV